MESLPLRCITWRCVQLSNDPSSSTWLPPWAPAGLKGAGARLRALSGERSAAAPVRRVRSPRSRRLTDDDGGDELRLRRPPRKLGVRVGAAPPDLVVLGDGLHGYLRAVGERRAGAHRRRRPPVPVPPRHVLILVVTADAVLAVCLTLRAGRRAGRGERARVSSVLALGRLARRCCTLFHHVSDGSRFKAAVSPPTQHWQRSCVQRPHWPATINWRRASGHQAPPH